MHEIQTDRLIIKRFTTEYLTQSYVDWLNDKEIVKYSDQRFVPHSLASCKQYCESFYESSNEFWVVLAKAENELKHIGNITTYSDKNHGLVDISIMIGEKSLWGQGFGLEAWNGMCNYLLGINSTRKITAGTLEVNIPMLKIFEKAGMVKDGFRKKNCLFEGTSVDMIYYAMFSEDFTL